MEYIHICIYIYIYTYEQNQNSPTKIKYNSTLFDLANKGNKKLYLPVKNKTNYTSHWRTKRKQGAKWGIKQ